MNHRSYTTPRYYGSSSNNNYAPQSDSETSSTQSVRVSRLIEKIKAQQQKGGVTGGYLSTTTTTSTSKPFSYSNDLIYSRVAREQDQKRTIRERVPVERSNLAPPPPPSTVPFHKTTVLLNNDDATTTDSDWNYGYNNRRNYEPHHQQVKQQRYFGEETDYEYDRELSREVSRAGGAFSLQRNQSFKDQQNYHYPNHHHQTNSLHRNASIPKIILHEEAVAEIPNGKGGIINNGTRSPSFLDESSDHHQQQHRVDGDHHNSNNKSRFLGGLLTLKRGNKNNKSSSVGTIRSTTRSPLPTQQQQQRRTTSYLNVPSGRYSNNNNNEHEHDSSSSPKYYVPFYRSTPTLYESKYDRMSSTGGSVLSNGSYVNKHVSRSMSMKAPWEPRHRANEIDYYQDTYNTTASAAAATSSGGGKKRATLTRSKSMPGKKLSSIIGNWVSKNKNNTRTSSNTNTDKQDEAKLIDVEQKPTTTKPTSSSSNWGRFTLLRFGRNKKNETGGGNNKKSSELNNRGLSSSPERPARNKRYSNIRESVSPPRPNRYDTGTSGGGGTLLRGKYTTPRGHTSGGSSGNGRGFY